MLLLMEQTLLQKLESKGIQATLQNGQLILSPIDQLSGKQIAYLKRQRHRLIQEALDRLPPDSSEAIREAVALVQRNYDIQLHSNRLGGNFWLTRDAKTKQSLQQHKKDDLPVYTLKELKTLGASGFKNQDLAVINQLVAQFDASVLKSASASRNSNQKMAYDDPIQAINAWMDLINEQDPEIRRETLEKARSNPEAMQCFLRCAAEHGIQVQAPKRADPEAPIADADRAGRRRGRFGKLLRPV